MGVDSHHITDTNIQSNRPKYTFHIQIHHLRESFIRVCIELLTPSSPSVGEQNIHMISRFPDFIHQMLNIGDLGAVCSNRNGDGARAFGWKSVQGLAGSFARGGFSRCDVNFGTAGLKEAGSLS